MDWPIALALSGGSDSHALLWLAVLWARSRGRSLVALTVDHQLNPDSAQWTRQAADMADAAGIPWQGLAWTDPAKPLRGLQAAARTARYGLLSQAARSVGARVLLVGHTRDDVLENERMRATDTPGIGGLYPWRPVPVWPEGRGLMLCRPMLALRRETLRDWLRAKDLCWIEDPANANPTFARVRARQALVSKTEEMPLTLSEPDASRWLTAVSADRSGAMTLTRADLDELLLPKDTGAALRALSALILCVSGDSRPPRLEALEPILALLRTKGSEAMRTLGGTHVHLTPTLLFLSREFGRTRPKPVSVQAGETVIWDRRLQVRVDCDGILVPARGYLKGLSQEDKARLPRTPMARLSLPVLLTGGAGKTRLPVMCSLGLERLQATLGGIRCERDLQSPDTD
ncbi:MAG: tRNA lysidine(34) synthetase TilS [Asticcacaulis sp.]